jgi:hypothetical protein
VASLIKDPPPGAPVPPILPPEDGFLLLDKAKFRASFASDVDPGRAEFMADSQVPWGGGAQRDGHRARLEGQAELVPGRHRRPDDPAGGAAGHGQARPGDGRGGPRQSRSVRLPAGRGGRPDRQGRRG